jgi:sterol 3beta-glucosyltransferase
VDTAIQSIYRDLEYARSLILRKTGKNQAKNHDTDTSPVSDDEDEEESWTFVGTGDEVDPELIVKKSALADAEQFLTGSKVKSSSSLGSRVLSGKKKRAATATGS